MKLSEKQKDALLWLWVDGLRPWHGGFKGSTAPATITLMSLVDKGLAVKHGGNGFTAKYALLSAGAVEREKVLKERGHG